MLEKIGFKQLSETEFEGKKLIELEDAKAEASDSGDIFISGYVNTKNKPDSYGDIPTGDNVYDLSRFKRNPVLLVDHNNSAGFVAGKAVLTTEDEKGFYAKFLLMKNAQTDIVRHAIEAVKEGLLKAFSIGGKWTYDKANPQLLTKAFIHEVSLVAIGADPRALGVSSAKSMVKEKDFRSDFLAYLIKEYRKGQNQKLLQLIQLTKEL